MAVLSLFKIPYTFKNIIIFKGETRSKQFRAISPTGKVPILVIKSSGQTIFQSEAIVQYLILKQCKQDCQDFYPLASSSPLDDRKIFRAVRMQQFLSWHHLNLRQSAMILLGLWAPIKDKQGTLRKGKRFLERSLKFMNDYWLKERGYIIDDKLYSFADTQAVCELMQFALIQEYWKEVNDKQKYPRVVKWLVNMLSKKQIKEVYEKLLDYNLSPKL